MISRLNLYDENFNKIDIESLGLFGVKLTIPSPSYNTITEELDGGGRVVIEKKLESRSLIAEFKTVADSYEDSLSQKSMLYGLLGSGKEFYIEQIQRPNIIWKCNLGEWTPEYKRSFVTNFSIPLTCLTGTSQTISTIKKTYETTNFTFKNEGNILIDPRQHSDVLIKFSGASTDLTIKNNTTDDEWKYYGTTEDWDFVKLDGVKSIKNFGTSIFKDTNKKILTLAVGNNNFTISGASGWFELEISTRFYFL